MLFSAGLGVGLLFYGVAEPVMHFSSDALHEKGLFFNKANRSMNLAYLHWGFHGWAIYGIVGLCLNTLHTIRISLFSKLFKVHSKNIWGRVSLDVIAISATIFGIATSLG